MKSKHTQQDIDQFFESFKQLPEYYPLEKVHKVIRKPDVHVAKSVKINPLKIITMATIFTTGILTLLFWTDLFNNESKIIPAKNNASTYIPTIDSVEKEHTPAPMPDESTPGTNRSFDQEKVAAGVDDSEDSQAKPKLPPKINQGDHKNSGPNNPEKSEGDTVELAGTPVAVESKDDKKVDDRKNHKRSALKSRSENLLNGINFIELSPEELVNLGFTIRANEINYFMKSNNDIVALILYDGQGQGVRVFEDSTINGNIHKIVFLSNIYGKQHVKWKGPDDHKDKWEPSYFQEKIQFLIPIVLRKKAFPEILYQDQVFWFEPTKAFLNDLPEAIRTPLQKEYDYLTASKTDIKIAPGGSCTYFEACRSSLPLNELKLYPNPARKTTTIKFQSLKGFTGAISLLNINGDLVRELVPKTTFPSNYSNTYKLDLSDIPPGMYLVSIITDKGFKTQRLIVQ